MSNESFDPAEYYRSYPKKVIMRPGYPARAQFKSTLMWQLFGKQILRELGEIKYYGDIGGCFGFGANSMAFQISECQGYYPKTVVFEISSEFITIGKLLFPYINFVEGEFINWNGSPDTFDLVTLFDVVEHIYNPKPFLQNLSLRAKFVLLKTPMETTGEWFGSCPSAGQGNDHPDGHLNFFNPASYTKMINDSGFQIIKSYLRRSIVPRGAKMVLMPEDMCHNMVLKSRTKNHEQLSMNKLLNYKLITQYLKNIIRRGSELLLPFRFSRYYLGWGEHLCLARSKKLTKTLI